MEPIRPGKVNLIPNTREDLETVWNLTRDEQIDRTKIMQTQRWFARHGKLSPEKAEEMDTAAERQRAIIDEVYGEVEHVLGSQSLELMKSAVRSAAPPPTSDGPAAPPTVPPQVPKQPEGDDQFGLF